MQSFLLLYDSIRPFLLYFLYFWSPTWEITAVPMYSKSMYPNVSPVSLLSSSLRVSSLTLKSLIQCELIFVQRKGSTSDFYLPPADIQPSQTISWKGCPSSNVCFWHICWKSVGWWCMGLLLSAFFSSSSLSVYFSANTILFLLLWLCSMSKPGTLRPPALFFFFSELRCFFGVFRASTWILGFFSSPVKNIICILMGISPDCTTCWAVWPF